MIASAPANDKARSAEAGVVLVTGATGLVGRYVVPVLLAEGYRLRLALRRPMPGGLEDGRIQAVVVGDLAEAQLEGALDGVAAVVHVAGLAGGRFPEADFMRANVQATERLCGAARTVGVRRFVHISSIMAVTDNSAPNIVRDDTPAAPTTIYGRSKRAGETAVAALGKEMLAVSLRPPLVIAGDAGSNWRRLMQLAATGLPLPFAGAHAHRSYIAADDLAQAISAILANEADPDLSGAYLVSTPPALSLPEVIGALRRGMQRGPALFPAPVAWLSAAGKLVGARAAVDSLFGRLEIDGSRFAERFGFRPSWPLISVIEQCGAEFAAGAMR